MNNIAMVRHHIYTSAINNTHIITFVWLLLLSLFIYSGNAQHQLLKWDDISYVSANPWVTEPSWANLKAMFTEFRLFNWHPLTWLSYVPEYAICAEKAWCYKTTNGLLHGINAFLVYLLTYSILIVNAGRITHDLPDSNLSSSLQTAQFKLAALFAGTLFVVHTQHTESVIWVAERKDLLCALFYLMAVHAYLMYQRTEKRHFAFLIMLFFFMALMSKSMAITLPFALLVIDVFPLRRISGKLDHSTKRALIEKTPLYIFSLATVLITLMSQSVDSTEQPEFTTRIVTAIISCTHYIISLLYLVDFSPFYPYSLLETEATFYITFALIIAAILGYTLVKYGRPAIATLMSFLLVGLPILGLIKVGEHAFADRYTYLPMVGFYIALSALLSQAVFRYWRYRQWIIGIFLTCTVLMGVKTHEYKEVWQSDISLWKHVSNKYPKSSYLIHNNLGNSYFSEERYQEAATQYDIAIELAPDIINLYNNKHLALRSLGNLDLALKTVEQSLQNNPGNHFAHYIIGNAYFQQRQSLETHKQLATKHYLSALEIYQQQPEILLRDPETLLEIAKSLFALGGFKNGITAATLASTVKRSRFEAQLILAEVYALFDKKLSLNLLKALEIEFGPDPSIDMIKERYHSNGRAIDKNGKNER